LTAPKDDGHRSRVANSRRLAHKSAHALCRASWDLATYLRADDFKRRLLHHGAGVAAGEVHSPPPQPVQVSPPPAGALLKFIAHALGQPCNHTYIYVREGPHHVGSHHSKASFHPNTQRQLRAAPFAQPQCAATVPPTAPRGLPVQRMCLSASLL
jgi:hypothetical protein